MDRQSFIVENEKSKTNINDPHKYKFTSFCKHIWFSLSFVSQLQFNPVWCVGCGWVNSIWSNFWAIFQTFISCRRREMAPNEMILQIRILVRDYVYLRTITVYCYYFHQNNVEFDDISRLNVKIPSNRTDPNFNLVWQLRNEICWLCRECNNWRNDFSNSVEELLLNILRIHCTIWVRVTFTEYNSILRFDSINQEINSNECVSVKCVYPYRTVKYFSTHSNDSLKLGVVGNGISYSFRMKWYSILLSPTTDHSTNYLQQFHCDKFISVNKF